MKLMDYFASRVAAPLYARYEGSKRYAYMREVSRVIAGSLPEIREYQLGRIRAVAADAVENTEYYAGVFADLGLNPATLTWEEFKRIPLLTKDIIREQGGRLVNKRFPLDGLRESATGGTTASPMKIHMDWDSVQRRHAATMVFDRWVGFMPGMRGGFLWGASQDFPAEVSLKRKLLNALVQRNKFYTTESLDGQTLQRYCEQLQRTRPALIQAYPTPLRILAEYMLENDVRIDVPAITCTAEPLTDSARATIEKAFGRKVHEWYGSREAGRVATECGAHDGMHVNSYGLYVEVLEDRDEIGGGEIVISDLWNVGMPMLRYATGDLSSLDETPCACGSSLPRLSPVKGRTAEVFVSLSGRKVPGVAFTNRIIKDDSLVREMQIIQKDYTKFLVRVIPGQGYGEDARQWLVGRLEDFMGQKNEVVFQEVESIPRERSGKLLFCKREFDPRELESESREAEA
ncbi:phenylacetate--CoA ligase family protein [Pseudodesulfovibrio karagichevae]|uniref:Phenylacetate--CoA ligase family protein n=1 Tax=Pseudodesulfovibrio karagichevae TaxID=3239305 RepID=A0ABV4K152_9BACT